VDAGRRPCHDLVMKRSLGVVAIVAVVAVTALVVIVVARVVGSDSPGEATAAAGTFPQGVYRYRLSKQDVMKVVSDISPAALADSIGTFTWTLRDGVITLVQTNCKCTIPGVKGHYEATAGRLTVRWPHYATNGVEFCASDCVETVRWTYDGAALHIEPLTPAPLDLVFWGANKPWQRIE
jgi:hypothetical protein